MVFIASSLLFTRILLMHFATQDSCSVDDLRLVQSVRVTGTYHAQSYQLEQSITTGSPVASFSHFKSQNHSKPEANISVKNRGKLLVLKLRLICNIGKPLGV